MNFAPGSYVVYRGQGLAKVQNADDEQIVLQLSVDDADTLEVPAGEADKRLRAPLDKSGAEKIMTLLGKKEGKPDARAWGEQYADIQKALRKGDAKALAERLHLMLRTSAPLSSTVERAL